ncbi:g13437 [Coccomyxa viridis]|uniref:thiamine diphosphokinase n=1 Tax=Coccomyxa viridis TaxID=1274662 RepID=A0ABP1GCR8_9CHLO
MLSNRFLSSVGGTNQRLVLLILNFRLPPVTFALWRHAHVRIVADGGANRLYDALSEGSMQQDRLLSRSDYVPDIIRGDLDSIRPDVLDYYSKLGTQVVDESGDQDSTDLQKCIACAHELIASRPGDLQGASIFAAGAFGGRIDHVLSSLCTLHRHEGEKIILCGDGNLVRLLPCGHTDLEPDLDVEGPACGLVAMAAPATASSQGLKWNLESTQLEVQGLQSTSNTLAGSRVSVDTDQPLLWMTEFRDPLEE